MVTTIITAILSFFELISVVTLGILNGFFGGEAFRELMWDAIASGDLDYEGFATASEAVDFTLSMVTTGLIVAMVFCVLITAFGIFASVIGFKTIADKALTAAAAQNTAAQQSYNMPNYQNNYNSSYQGGYGYQNNAQQPFQGSYSNSYGQPQQAQQYQQNYQAPMQNAAPTGQPASNAVNATAPQNGDWYCVCGSKNTSGQKFCSNCGAKKPE